MIKTTKNGLIRFILVTIFLLLISISTGVFNPVQAQSNSDFEVEIEIGFDGHCKFGYWLPIYVLFNAQNLYFSGHLSISYSQSEYLFPISLTPNAQKSIRTQIFTNIRDVNQTVTLQLIPEQDGTSPIFLERKNLTCVANRILGVITDTPTAFTMLNSLPPVDSTDVVILSYANLPENVLGFQNLDALFVANTDTSNLSLDQYNAIKLWIAQGGHLILSGGTNWQSTFLGFEDLLPLKVNSSRTLNIHSGFSSFGNALDLLNIILVEGTLQEESKILLVNDEHPLVVQRQLGAGTVSLITFDPNISAFRRSENALLFFDYLLGSTSSGYDFVSIKDWNSAIQTVSLFQNQNLPTTWWILTILILFILILGPAHFYILKRLNKSELVWFTLPVVTFLLTTVVIALGWQFRGIKPQINQMAVVHQWVGSEQAYTSGLVGIFSPRRDNYQVSLEAGFTPYPFAPHNYFNTPNNEWDFIQSDVFSAETKINASEIMPLGILGNVQPLSIRSDLNLNLESATAILSGEIWNESSIDLRNVILFYPGGFEYIGDLPADESLRIDLPMDLLSQKSSNSSSLVFSNVYNPSTYYGDIIEGEINPSTIVAKNKTQQQLNLIEAILGNYTVPPVGFLLVGWNDTQAAYQVSIPVEEFDTSFLTAYLVSLPISTRTSTNQMILPPVLFSWFITETNTMQSSEPYQMRFGYLDQVEVYYKLVQPISYSKVVDLIIHLEGQDSRPDFPLNVFLWNFEQNQWDQLRVGNWNDVFVPDPMNYIDKNLTEVRIKLAENGTGGGDAKVTRADVSIVVEP